MPHKAMPYLLHHNRYTMSIYSSCTKTSFANMDYAPSPSIQGTHKLYINIYPHCCAIIQTIYNNTGPHTRDTFLLSLLLCGDACAIANPGPYQPKHSCVRSTEAVKWGKGPSSATFVVTGPSMLAAIAPVDHLHKYRKG